MLVISRRFMERIRIGDNIWITVTYLSDGRVKLGIDAPRSINVAREEVLPPEERYQQTKD